MSYFEETSVKYSDSPNLDSFGRLRTSEPYTLFDSKLLLGKEPLYYDEVVGGSATSVYSTGNACVDMTVTANAADYVLRQTKMSFNYQPAKSQLGFFTSVLSPEAGVTKRVGLFDHYTTGTYPVKDGVGFYTSGSEWGVEIVKTGIISRVASTSFSYDKLDGTGPSKFTIDMTKTQILGFSFEWLGVGEVCFFTVASGTILPIHKTSHTNNLGNVFMSTPNLPVSYEIRSLGSAGSLKQICSSIISEGGLNPNGKLLGANVYNITGPSADTEFACMAIRITSGYWDSSVLLNSIDIMTTTAASGRWRIVLNPTIGGSLTYAPVNGSVVEKATGASTNTVTAGTGYEIANGFFSNQGRSATEDIENAIRLGKTIAGVGDVIAVCVTATANNVATYASLSWREIP